FRPGSGDLTFGSTFTQTNGTFTPGTGALNFNGAITVNGGTFNAPTGALNISSNLTVAAAAVFNTNGGTLAFTGVGSQTLILPAAFTVNNLAINKTNN